MSFFTRLKSGLSKSSSKLGTGINDIFVKRKVDAETLAELEELLITADLGPKAAAEIIAAFSKAKFGKEASLEEIKSELAQKITELLQPFAKKLEIDKAQKPFVILMAGANGSGKTTTIGKLAAKFKAQKFKVMLAACDTFRAAAGSQLSVWAERANCPLVEGKEGADPASVAYQAYERAKKEGFDILLIDTAGRLQNKAGLMEELGKIIRALKKIDETAPHLSLLVLDATIGQNAFGQAEAFKSVANINGIIINKLDGTAKGGSIVPLAQKLELPIYIIGVGEAIEDLDDFNAEAFAKSLVGIN